MAHISDYEKFKLLVWKTIYTHLHSPVKLTFSILSPSLFCLVLVVLRFSIPTTKVPVQKYPPINIKRSWTNLINLLSKRYETMDEYQINFTHNTYVPQLIVGYAPNTNKAFNDIMEKTELDWRRVDLRGYTTCALLRKTVAAEHLIAGVCFDSQIFEMNETETLHFYNSYPNRLNFTLIYPSELRIYSDTFISSSWSTNTKYHQFEKTSKKSSKYVRDGGYVGYCREGFIPLQYAISESYLKLISKRNDLPKVVMRRFPYPEHYYDPITNRLEMLLMMTVLSGYFYPLAELITQAVIERESQLRDILQIMGVSYKIYFAAFYFTGLILISIGSFLMIIILKIHWYYGDAILSKSSWYSLFCLMTFYNSSTICFCFMLSSFFSLPSTASAFGGLLWYASYLPYLLSLNIENFFSPTWYMCIFSNSVISFAFKNILQFEAYSEGLQMSYFFRSAIISNKLSIGMYLPMLVTQSIAYAIIGIYMDYIDFNSVEILPNLTNVFNKVTGNRYISQRRRTLLRLSTVHEIEPVYKNSTIEINNLTKMYAGKEVVRNVTMKLYEDDITVLMGHNGCGKSTLLSMIAGIIKPSKGRVIIRDLHFRPDVSRSGLGISLDANALFKDLSVENQLSFFSNIRGTPLEKQDEEIHKYLTAMNLFDKRYILTRDLTDGQRQQLAVCCALIGNSKIVVLDDPSSKMDVTAQKSLWNLLTKEKRGRTIILSTHNTDEAIALASCMAILSNGAMRYNGSTSLLKSVYSTGFQLICVRGQYCDVDAVTELIQKYIPHVTPISRICKEFSYIFEEKYGGSVADILQDIEAKCDDLDLESYSFRQISMEDIFFQLGAQDPSYGDVHRQSDIWNGKPIFTEEYEKLDFLDTRSLSLLRGPKLWASHWRAMLLKHARYNYNFALLNILLISVPVLCVTLSFVMTNKNIRLKQLKPISFDLNEYDQTITVIDKKYTTNEFIKKIASKLSEMFFWIGNLEHKLEDTNGEIIEEYLLMKKRKVMRLVNYQYIFAVEFGNRYITAWFNNHAMHTAPLALNIVQNAMLRVLLDDNAKITVIHDPLPFVNPKRLAMMESTYNVGSLLAVCLVFSTSFICAYSVVFLVKENRSRFKLLQFISGVRFFIFWISKFVWDIARAMIIAIGIAGAITCFKQKTFADVDIITKYSIVLFLSAACLISMSYVISLFFENPSAAYSATTAIFLYGATSFCTSYHLLTKYYGPFYLKGDHPVEWVLRIFPLFSTGNALVKIYYSSELSEVCENDDVYLISAFLEDCKVEPNCCQTRHTLQDKACIEKDIYYLIGITIINWLVLFLLECRVFWRSENFFGDVPDDNEESVREDHERRHADNPDDKFDDSPLREQVKVLTLRPHEYYNKALICDHVTKTYNKKKAVDRLNLIVERAECFGMVGGNGSGKSVILKILVGDEKMSFGRIFANSLNIKKNLYKMYKCIGYCPDNTKLMSEFTPLEIMKMICLLRGTPANKVLEKCESAAKVIGFYKDYEKKLKMVCSGNKKRLCCTLALINAPAVIYLDEPTDNIDPAGRRQLWNTIRKLPQRNTTVIFTSKKKYECERNCNRLAVLSEGRLTKIGNIIEISNKFPQGHLLYLKLKDTIRRRASLSPIVFIETEFPRSSFKDSFGDILVFFIPLNSTKLSKIFDELQRNVFNLNIDYFVITRDRLADVF